MTNLTEVLILEDKAIKPATFSTIRTLLLFAALAIGISTFVYVVTDGAETRQLFVSTEGVADMKKTTESDIVMEYKTDDFYAYFLRSKNEMKKYSMIKKIGLWVYHYPSTKNPQGITVRGDTLYYYDSLPAGQAETVRLVTPDGSFLEPVMQKKIQIGAAYEIAFVAKIDDYGNQIGDYLIELVSADGSSLTNAETGLVSARFTLIFDEKQLEEFAQRKYVVKNGENGDLWSEVYEATKTALTQENTISLPDFDTSATPHSIRALMAEINRGWHLTLYSSKEYYVWQDQKNFKVLLDTGQGSLVIETEQDYREVNGSKDFRYLAAGIETKVYKLTAIEAVASLFDVFKP